MIRGRVIGVAAGLGAIAATAALAVAGTPSKHPAPLPPAPHARAGHHSLHTVKSNSK